MEKYSSKDKRIHLKLKDDKSLIESFCQRKIKSLIPAKTLHERRQTMKKDLNWLNLNILKKLNHLLAIALLIGLLTPVFAFSEADLTLETFWQVRLELK